MVALVEEGSAVLAAGVAAALVEVGSAGSAAEARVAAGQAAVGSGVVRQFRGIDPHCHPERSEGPLLPAHTFARVEVLRFAQDVTPNLWREFAGHC